MRAEIAILTAGRSRSCSRDKPMGFPASSRRIKKRQNVRGEAVLTTVAGKGVTVKEPALLSPEGRSDHSQAVT